MHSYYFLCCLNLLIPITLPATCGLPSYALSLMNIKKITNHHKNQLQLFSIHSFTMRLRVIINIMCGSAKPPHQRAAQQSHHISVQTINLKIKITNKKLSMHQGSAKPSTSTCDSAKPSLLANESISNYQCIRAQQSHQCQHTAQQSNQHQWTTPIKCNRCHTQRHQWLVAEIRRYRTL